MRVFFAVSFELARCLYSLLNPDCQASDVVVIHDAARPFVPEETISRVATAAQGNKVQWKLKHFSAQGKFLIFSLIIEPQK